MNSRAIEYKSGPNSTIVTKYENIFLAHEKNAVEEIIEMTKSLYELREDVKSGKLSKSDEIALCEKVGLRYRSQYHTNCISIGKSASIATKNKEKRSSEADKVYQVVFDSRQSEGFIQESKITRSMCATRLKTIFKVLNLRNALVNYY